MKTPQTKNPSGSALCGIAIGSGVLLGAALMAVQVHAADKPKVIELTQVGCQFLESENGVNHGYSPESAADCKAINSKTKDQRLSKAKVLKLKPGEYVFRVTNKNVPYGLGFWLRGSGLGRLTLPSVSGGGLTEGKTLDYKITLKPGSYVYSCPLNPTPDYKLKVEG